MKNEQAKNRRTPLWMSIGIPVYEFLFLFCGILGVCLNPTALRFAYGCGLLLLWLGMGLYTLLMALSYQAEDDAKKEKRRFLARLFFFGSFTLFAVLILWIQRYLDPTFSFLDFKGESGQTRFNSAYFFLGLILGVLEIVTRLLKGNRGGESYRSRRYVSLRAIPLLLLWTLAFSAFFFGQLQTGSFSSPVAYLWIPSLLMIVTLLLEYLLYGSKVDKRVFLLPFFLILLSFALLGLFF